MLVCLCTCFGGAEKILFLISVAQERKLEERPTRIAGEANFRSPFSTMASSHAFSLPGFKVIMSSLWSMYFSLLTTGAFSSKYDRTLR